MKDPKICSACLNTFCTDSLTEFEGELLCSTCFAEQTTVCSHCGTRIWRDDNAGSHSTPLCYTCYDEYYTTCAECGQPLLREAAYYYDDDPYCEACHDRYASNCAIQEYDYKPEPIFHGQGNRFLGVELEVDEAGEYDSCAEAVMCIGNRNDEHIYCKHDGSLDDGFEIVTHPMTLHYHQNHMPWNAVLSKLRDMGYLSHKTNTCGLHVHVNRCSLGDTEEEQETCIARILYFVEKNWEELLKFSRRTSRQLDRWAARYGYKEHPQDILDHAKKGLGNGRYSCINLQNDQTIEFRLFRGTLKYNTIIATLQLVNRVCDVAFSLSDDEMKALSWTSFVSECTEPELIQYLKERCIYVNDPVFSEEDV